MVIPQIGKWVFQNSLYQYRMCVNVIHETAIVEGNRGNNGMIYQFVVKFNHCIKQIVY